MCLIYRKVFINKKKNFDFGRRKNFVECDFYEDKKK